MEFASQAVRIGRLKGIGQSCPIFSHPLIPRLFRIFRTTGTLAPVRK